jgi:hypothetical protein
MIPEKSLMRQTKVCFAHLHLASGEPVDIDARPGG